MKIHINGYDVTITARADYNTRANKRDAMFLLNEIAIWVGEAAETYRNEKIKNLYKRIDTEIYEQLKAAGFYD